MKLRIREARIAAGLKQRDVAEKIGLSQPYFAQIERGERRLNTEFQIKISEALGVKPDDLVDFDAPNEADEEYLLTVFRSLPPERRQGWMDMAKASFPQKKATAEEK